MGLADFQPNTLDRTPSVRRRQGFASRLLLGPLAVVLLLSLVVGTMAYQAPPGGRVQIGWLGDRLFLETTSGLGAEPLERGDLFADDLAPDSPTLRSRWTREYAVLQLPNIGAGAGLDLTLTAQGWPEDVLAAPVEQPDVQVFADGLLVGSFTPTPQWQEHHFTIPEAQRATSDLLIELRSSHSFTDTLSFANDPRQKALRLAELQVAPSGTEPRPFYPPAWPALLLLCANMLVLYLLVARFVRSLPVLFTITTAATGIAAIGLAVARIWMGAALSVSLVTLIVLLVISYQRQILSLVRHLVRRYASGRALGYGLVAAALIWFAYTLGELLGWLGAQGRPLFWTIFPDSLLYGLLGAGLLCLVLVLGREGLPQLSDSIVRALGSRRGALIVLGLFSAVWVGYEAAFIAAMPYVGHADYSDNAVVARNLVAGRGWVVDYVSQFYQLYPSLTHPQETWPLLQPVWIAPFFRLFGATNWAAKIPNLLFNLALIGLIYHAGTYLWNRRVGLTAAIFVLTNSLFFNLTIYVTSDLAFVVFNFAAMYLLYRASEPQPNQAAAPLRLNYLIGAGILTGLMMLQKPSGAMIAFGFGLFLLYQVRGALFGGSLASRMQRAIQAIWPIALWTGIALLILSPYLLRNLALFGRPVFSTESYDAWVLGYRGASGDAWSDIYLIFAPELNGLGIPDHSWILRWGFDATLTKFQTQIRELRDYLLPVWHNLPAQIGWIFGRTEEKNIASDLGAWLSLIGLIAALRFRRRLLSLLAFAYLPYMVFMLTYWRADEDRYWVMLLPWIGLLGAWIIWASYDRLAAIGDRRWAPLGLILAAVMITIVVNFSRPDIANKVRNEPDIWAPDLAAYAWIDANTPEDSVLMTRLPWQANWHTERSAVMIPNTADRAMLLQIAQHYGADYLVLENQLRVKGAAGQLLSPQLRPGDTQVGESIDGFRLVYASPTDDFRAFVYEIPEE